MDHPKGHIQAVYLNDYCRRVFSEWKHSRSTQKSSIRFVVRERAVVVADFSEDKLVEILRYLIGKRVFYSVDAAALEFPELCVTDFTHVRRPTTPPTECQQHNVRYCPAWLEDSFDDASYSDLTLICRGKRYSAHRAIVCPQSPVIAKKCQFQDTAQGPSYESCGAEPRYCFDFLDDDPQIVDCLIQYFYRQNYQKNYSKSATDGAELGNDANTVSTSSERDDIDDFYPLSHARVYALAEMYDIPALKELALEKFSGSIQHNSELERFLEGVEEAYTSTVREDTGLRHVITRYFYTHSGLLNEEQVKDTLQRIDSLSYDLLMYWHKYQAT